MLNRFRNTCCYCYHSVESSLYICSCDLSVCKKHYEMHSKRFGCEIFFTVKAKKVDDKFEVNVDGIEDENEISRKIKFLLENGITGDEQNGKVCEHITKQKSDRIISHNEELCEMCKISGNLWVCIECGHIGCGRNQVGTNGQGHAKIHSEINGPNCQQCIYLTSIGSGTNQIYCYKCDDYIVNKIDIKIRRNYNNVKYSIMKENETMNSNNKDNDNESKDNNNESKDNNKDNDNKDNDNKDNDNKDNDIMKENETMNSNNKDNDKDNDIMKENETMNSNNNDIMDNNNKDKNKNKNNDKLMNNNIEKKKADKYVGIINKGETCYISAVLQLLGKSFEKINLETHFNHCNKSPIDCFCCQFIKIMKEVCKEEMNKIDISDFLRILFIEALDFTQGKQEDCVEMLETILINIASYEFGYQSSEVLPSFSFNIEKITECSNCGENNERILYESNLYVEPKESICKSLADYFEGYTINCKCGKRPNVTYKIIKWPQRLIVVLKRYKMSNGVLCKINDLIEVGDFLTGDFFLGNDEEKLYKFVGCVCHEGTNIEFGHYTWWTIKDGDYFLFDDDKITYSIYEKAKEGVVFLFELAN